MDIGAAIRLLCEAYTRPEPRAGFQFVSIPDIEGIATPEEFTEAWATLRRAVDLPTEPEIPRDTDSRLTENNILR